MIRSIKYFGLLILLFLTAACAHRPSITPPETLQKHQQLLQSVSNWEIYGKLGVRTPSDSGSASLKWAQQAARYQLNLSGPLGQKRVIITGAPGRVQLEQSGEPALQAKTPEALIKKQLGWTLPVTQLAYWVRGIPAPSGRITQLTQNDQGLIAQLHQGNWSLTYSNYSDQLVDGQTIALPGKVTAEYGEVRLVLAIRQWRLGAKGI